MQGRMGKCREQEETRVTDLRNGGRGGWEKREGFSAAVQDRGEEKDKVASPLLNWHAAGRRTMNNGEGERKLNGRLIKSRKM